MKTKTTEQRLSKAVTGKSTKKCRLGFLLRVGLLLMLLVSGKLNAQTLSVGDIAFTSYASDAGDTFSIVILTSLNAGTTIGFTDGEWVSASGKFQMNGATNGYSENFFEWQTTGPVSPGTEVKFYTSGAGNKEIASIGSVVRGRSLSLTIAGDQIFCYQGATYDTSGADWSTHINTITPTTIIAGIHANVISGTTTASNWDGVSAGTTSTSTTELPAVLTNGVNAIWIYDIGEIEKDNGALKCSVLPLTGTDTQKRTTCNTVANWDFDDITPIPWPRTDCGPTCSMTASITSQTNVSCSGGNNGALTVTQSGGTANFTYSWTNGSITSGTPSSTNSISGLTTNLYTVTVTDNNSCTATASATITAINTTPATPTITPGGPTTFCAGGSVTLTSSSASGNQWYLNGNPIGGETNQTYSATASGNYTVIVTASGCSSSPSTATTVTVNPTPSTPTITPGGPTTFCSGGSVTLTSSSASGNQWYESGNPIGGETNQTYSATASGNYTVIVTASGCSSSPSTATTVTVNPTPSTPTITPGGPTTFCSGGSVTLTSSSASGNQWYESGNPIGGETGQTYSATANGNYTVIVTSGCSSSPSTATTVTVNPTPSTPTITPGGPTTFCSGGSVTLTSSSASGNQWYESGNPIGGETGQTYSATASGNYTVIVTTSGCSSSASAPTTVTVNPIPSTPTITPGGPTTFCTGGSVTLTSSSASGNQWYLDGNPIGGAINQTYSATASGNYTVIVTTSGCSSSPSSVTTVTVNPIPVLTLVSVVDGIDLTVTGGTSPYDYLWSNSEITEDLTGFPAGTYSVTVTDDNGCTETGSESIYEASLVCYNTAPNSFSNLTPPSGGSGTYVYEWEMSTNGGGSWSAAPGTNDQQDYQAPALTQSTLFRRKVTDTGCSATAYSNILNVVVNPQIILSTSVTNVSCGIGSTGEIDLTVSGGTGPYDYLWSNSAITQDITGLAVGPYSVTVTDDNNCTATTSATVAAIDNTNPVALCQNITIQLDATGNVSITGAQIDNGSSDACGIGSLSVSPNTFTCANIGSNTVTLTVTDVNSNSSTCTATVTVEDNVDPVATCQNVTVQLDATGNASVTAAQVNNGSTDACGVASLSVTPNTFTCANVGANTVTLTVTDVNNNTSTCTATVTVEDNVDPVATCQNITAQLDATGNVSITGAQINNGSTDACGIASLSVTPNTFTCANSGANTVTLTVTDNNGNTSTCTSTVTVEDTIDPVITCPANITISCEDSQLPANTGMATATDNCATPPAITSSDVTTPGSCAGNYSIARTWTANDGNGNLSTCVQTITVQDITPPVITCAADTLVNCNTSITPGFTGNVTATDNCGPAGVAFVDVITPGSCTYNYTVTRTWTATDACSNSSSCIQIITLQDTTPPVVVCPADTIIDCNTSTTPGFTGNLFATDECGSPGITLSDVITPGSCANNNTVTRTWTATDACGNATSCIQIITLQDTLAPVITCPNDTVVDTDAGLCTATIALHAATGTDNCGSAAITNNAPSFFTVGTTTVIWTATDACGNTSTCTQLVTVEDNEDPIPVCQSITVQLDAGGNASITAAQVDNGSTDACGIASLSVTPNTFTCANVGANTVTLTVTDNNGNTSTCTATVTVEDNVDPVATCQNITVQLDAGGNASITGAQINNGSTDACGVASLSVTPNTFTCANVGANPVTLTVTDVNGNSSTCTATVTIEDNVDPVASCQDITVYLDATGVITIAENAVNNGSADACGIATFDTDINSFTCADIGTNPVILTVTDVNGNSSTCSSTVTVLDTIAPVTACRDLTVYLDATGNVSIAEDSVDNGSTSGCGIASYDTDVTSFTCADVGPNTVVLTVTDGIGNSSTCSATVTVNDTIDPVAICQNITVQLDATGNVSITGAEVDNGSSDACGIATLSVSPNSFTCANIGANTVTLTVTDVNNNTSTCTATVTVEDNVDPVATCQNITVQLDATGNVSITAADVDNGSSDACGIASLAVSQSSFTCGDVGPNTVTLTVTDNNSNVSTCTSTVTVEDNVDPIAICQDLTVQLDAAGNGSITAAQIDNGSNDACGIASLSVSPNTFTCANVGANTVTLTVTDNNGNSSTCTSTVTVEDNVDPVAVCQNITVQLDASGNVTLNAVDLDGGSSDACGIATYSANPPTLTCLEFGPNPVTLTVTDNNGNVESCIATVTVEDNVAPVATCQNITIQLDAGGDASIVAADVDGGSTDACGIASLAIDITDFDCSDVGPNTVTLTVTDIHGNSSTCTSTVTVEDNVAPVAVCQNVTVQLDANGNGSITPAQIDNGSNDACGIASLSVSPNTFTCANVGNNTVTLTVTDVNGNTSTCTATVTVEDNIAPVVNCQDITVQLDNVGQAAIFVQQVHASSSDACGIVSRTVSPNQFNCSDIGANTVTVTVTDVNGNVNTCTATVTVEDNIAPVAVCNNITVQLDANGSATIVAADVDGGSHDACGIASTSIDVTDFDCSDIGANTVTLTVTDNNGNVSTCTATVTVEDNVAPGAVCQNLTIQLDASGNASITAAQVNNGSSDACGIASVTVSQTDFDCDDVGANTVILSVTDVNGNTGTCTATVTVEDNIDPVAVCQDITIQLDANGNATISGSDVDGGSSDECGIASVSVSQANFDCSDVGANTVTLTVTDNNGNTNTCTATVTVEDNVDPVAVCQDITIQLDANGAATIVAADVDGGSSDACGIASVTVSQADFDCSDIGPNTVTLTVTDNNGNVNTCTATVTVEDNINPDVVCQDITIQLDANGAATITANDMDGGSTDACGIASATIDVMSFDCSDIGDNTVTLTVTDNNGNTATCTATVTVEDNTLPAAVCQNITIDLDENGEAFIVAGDVDGGSADACGIASVTVNHTAFDCSNLGANTVTLTVTDNNGNTSTCTATVTVEDNIDPVLTVQADTIICAQGLGGTAVNYSTPVFRDNCSGPVLTQTAGLASGSVFPIGTTTNTFEVTDAAGNTVSASFTVTVNSQATADFTFVSTCSDSPVEFTNTSTTGTGTIDQFDWDFGDGGTSTDEDPSHLFAGGGTYPVTLTVVTDMGCIATVTHDVAVDQAPTFSLQVTNVSCNGQNDGVIVISINSGSGPFYHSLNGGPEQQLNTFSGLAPGTYTVSTRNTSNCTSIQTVTVTQPAALTLSVTDSTAVTCGDDNSGSITVAATGGTAPYQYSLDGNVVNTTGVFNATGGGVHSIMITDANGCTLLTTVSVPVLVALPVAGFTIDVNGFEVEFTNTSVGATSFYWEFGDGPASTSENPTHTYFQPGIYTAMLIVSNECGSDTFYVNVDMTTGINNPDQNGYSINVYPNPNNGSFTMMLESAGFMNELSIRLWTVEGKLIDDMIVAPAGNKYTRSFSYELAAGMYVLEVSDKNAVHHKQVIVR